VRAPAAGGVDTLAASYVANDLCLVITAVPAVVEVAAAAAAAAVLEASSRYR